MDSFTISVKQKQQARRNTRVNLPVPVVATETVTENATEDPNAAAPELTAPAPRMHTRSMGEAAFTMGAIFTEDCLTTSMIEPYVPKTFEEAVDPNNPWAPHWIEAMKEDIIGKKQNGERGAWDEVDIEQCIGEGRTPLKGKWVFTIKWNGDVIERFKARWVGCGYSQIEGQDYTETFSATLRGTTIRCFLSEVASNDYELNGIDVTKAFTHAKMTERVYVEMPHGFVVPGKVCLLNQALEGTKQAAHLWQQDLNNFMVNQYGMTRSKIDPCLYTKETEEGRLMIIVWVDDLLCASSNQKLFEEFYAAFGKTFNATKDTNVRKFVGLNITRDRAAKTLKIDQSTYIEKLFKRHLSARNTKEWKTPSGTSREEVSRFESITHAQTDEEKSGMIGKNYLQLIGGILFAACMTRPDITYHCGFLCQFMQNPSPDAYDAGLGIIAYLHQTKDLGLTYGGPRRAGPVEEAEGATGLVAYSDASFGKTPHPFAGGVIKKGNDLISWYSRKLKYTADSTCHAELGGIVTTLKETMFASYIYEDMFNKLSKPYIITDCKAAFDIIRNPGATKRSVHYERWLYMARDAYLTGKAMYILTTTDKMMADPMTKVVDRAMFFLSRKFLMNA